ncbi:polyketide synthase [Xylariaceae sp. FL0255]|nr:polyketide synthase [Xylariaceae sp. FL0255]
MPSATIASICPVAIIGMSFRLPGGANSIDELWQFLVRGDEAWTPVPPDRFNENAFYHPSPDNVNGTNHHQGGHFIKVDLRDFDHAFFRLSSQQAGAMDPQQRLLLELTYEAIENAGLLLKDLAGTNTSVHAATFTADYERNLYKDPLDLPVYYLTGTEKSIMSNRISHTFDLRGASMTIDTACSGGLVSLHQACLGLLNRESDISIVASANVTLSPDHHIGMSSLHLIGTGHSHPFDDRGSGYSRGEGCVVLVLKRLDEALESGDPIHAVIRGTSVNQNGLNPRGIAHPSGEAQSSLIRVAYERAGLNPYDVGYVEAHGTGTVAGDHEELAAIAEVFTGPGRSLPLYIGSIKGNIGHTENTSGLAGVLKAALVLERQAIPPVAGFKTPKPGLPLDHIRIPTEMVPFPQKEPFVPRVSVNSFGFGGTNGHAILERATDAPLVLKDKVSEQLPKLFVFSANSQASLLSMTKRYLKYLDEKPETDLWNLSYTLCCRRTVLPWRTSCVAQDRGSLQKYLLSCHSSMLKHVSSQHDSPSIFVFTGQGSQWVGMSRELLYGSGTSPIFRDSIRISRDILFELGATWDLELTLSSNDESSRARFATAEFAQPATTALQIALVTLLKSQGIRPDVVVGHSSGEIAAAFTAGYLSHRTALAVAFQRGFMRAVCRERGHPDGSMMAVALGEREVTPFLECISSGSVTVACVNSPQSVTVSGSARAIDQLAARLQLEGGITYRRLPVDTAYHSNHMQAVADDYANRIRHLEYSTAENEKNIFVSSVSGEIKTSGFDFEYWVENLVSPVQFCDAVQNIGYQILSHTANNHGVIIEIGPHASLAGPVRQCFEHMPDAVPRYDYTSVLRRKVDSLWSTSEFFGLMFQLGMKIDFSSVFRLAPGLSGRIDEASVLSNLPSYAWDHSVKHWHESRLSREYRFRQHPYHDLLGVRIVGSTPLEPRWRYIVDLVTLPWLEHHIVDELVIYPGSGYLCIVIEAMLQLATESPKLKFGTIAIRDVTFLRALVLPKPPGRREMQLSLKPKIDRAATFDFSVTALTDSRWHEHCRGTVQGISLDRSETPPIAQRHGDDIYDTDTILIRKELYDKLSATGNEYGTTFRGCRVLKSTRDMLRITAEVEIPDVENVMPAKYQSQHLIHPTSLDILLHSVLPMVKRHLGDGSVMPVAIEELLISPTEAIPRDPGALMQVAAELTSIQYRTAIVDYHIRYENMPVLSISGLEMRGMAGNLSQTLNSDSAQKTCYTLDWHTDTQLMRLEDFEPQPSISELFRLLCFKHADMTIIQLGIPDEGFTQSILSMVNAHNGTLSSYICVDSTSSTPDRRIREPSCDNRVRYIDVTPGTEDSPWGIEPHSCAVVLVSTVANLKHAATVVEKDGVILWLPEGDGERIGDEQDLVNANFASTLSVQYVIPGASSNKTVAILRYIGDREDASIPKAIRLLTHTSLHERPEWVKAISNNLAALGHTVTVDQMTTETSPDINSSAYFVIIDDGPDPILSDPTCFNHVTQLFRQAARIIWICPDTPQMFQITGFSRTAHAENSQLQLITIHSDAKFLEDERQGLRLVELLTNCFSRFTSNDNGRQLEREYRILHDGRVLVPRLHHSERLNKVITSNSDDASPETELCQFIDRSRRLVLSPTPVHGARRTPVFEPDPTARDTPPRDKEIEIQTRAFQMTPTYRTASCYVCAGIVQDIGPHVSAFAPNDRVVAIGAVGGRSHPRVHEDHVIRLPSHVRFSYATGLLPSVITACYSLYELARLKASGRVLVCGALTTIGRAITAVAKVIGAHVAILAANSTEPQWLMHDFDLPAERVIIAQASRSSLSSNRMSPNNIDVIVQATNEVIPLKILKQLKPFGSIILMHPQPETPTTLRNVSVHLCDISDILKLDIDLIADLMAKAAPVLQNMTAHDMELCVRDVSRVGEAVQLLDRGVYSNVIMSAEETSLVPAQLEQDVESDLWKSIDVSYIIVGGLGDLGRRLMILMAKRGAKYLVTLSRRVVENDDLEVLRAQLDSINPGCRLYCLKCDVTIEADIRAAASSLAQLGIPPVRGIIQSAGILQDRTLDSMVFSDFLVPTRIKIDGTLALKRVFGSSPDLKFFMMLSSTCSIVGTSGQGNYNAGNAVQDSIPHTHSNNTCHFMTLNIGWIEDAVATVNDDLRGQGLSRAGLGCIKSEELSRFFDHALGVALSKKRIPQMIIGFNTESLSQASDASGNGTMHSALFRHAYNAKGSDPPQTASQELSFDQLAANRDRAPLADFIAEAIAKRLSRVMSTDAMRIYTENASILDLGLDSLVAIELRNWIMQEFDAPLQSSEILLDQTIRMLAQKVCERSRKISTSAGKNAQLTTTMQASSDGTINEMSSIHQTTLPPLPVPNIKETLRLFQKSRLVFDSESDQNELSSAIVSFLETHGSKIQRQLESSTPDELADDYDRQLHLAKRVPLQDYNLFSLAHPMEAPQHSQALRAAIVTVAALNFARDLAAGELAAQTANTKCDWLFYATLRPEVGVDRNLRFPPSETIAVLRRGHVFKLSLGDVKLPLSVAVMRESFLTILDTSRDERERIGTLTADNRDDWALLRQNLASDTRNSEILSCLDECAFIICLDEEAPQTASERHTQFINNGPQRPFSNRWLDKAVEFSITDNGLSAGIFEHSKLDGLDARHLHRHVVKALMSSGPGDNVVDDGRVKLGSTLTSYPVQELTWTYGDEVKQRIAHLEQYFSSSSSPYGPIGYHHVRIQGLGQAFMRGEGVSANATAHITALTALFFVHGRISPAWEPVSLARFARGRRDWIQTVTPAMREFIEMIGTVVASSRDDPNKDKIDTSIRVKALSLFREAARLHSKMVAVSSQGGGFTQQMYAILGALTAADGSGSKELPALFHTKAWRETKVRNINLGFEPSEEDDEGMRDGVAKKGHSVYRWKEGGFLVDRDEGIFVLCDVAEDHTGFSVSGRPDYANAVAKGIVEAADVIKSMCRGD